METGAVSVSWDGYERFDLGVSGRYAEVPRREARQAFNRFLEARPGRIEGLGVLLGANGIDLGTDDASVQALNDWFFDHVEADPDVPGTLGDPWYSVAFDIAMYLGDVMVERHPNLRWEFFIWGKRNVAYQSPVIMGFGTEDPKLRTNLDLIDMVTAYGVQIIESRGSFAEHGVVEVRGAKIDVDAIMADHRNRPVPRNDFLRWLDAAAEHA